MSRRNSCTVALFGAGVVPDYSQSDVRFEGRNDSKLLSS